MLRLLLEQSEVSADAGDLVAEWSGDAYTLTDTADGPCIDVRIVFDTDDAAALVDAALAPNALATAVDGDQLDARFCAA
ncbi:MAG: hypothetical protein AAFZ07_03265 [Actinomycetota bacterium]